MSPPENGPSSDVSLSADEANMEENQSEFEEDEWGGITESQADGGENNVQSDIKTFKPSGEEVRAIKDAAELFKLNAFKLQIDALLPNVQPNEYHPLEHFLLILHTFLLNLPAIPPRHPLHGAQDLSKKGVSVPYSIPLVTYR